MWIFSLSGDAIASSCGATIVEVEQSAKPLAIALPVGIIEDC
jgi:hypothetical protein